MALIRVASRKSALALKQTEWVIARLQEVVPDAAFEIVPVVTKGDKVLNMALSKIGGKGLFVSEVEAVLQSGAADFAVHSLKDLPAQLGRGLSVAGMPKREDARDALVSRDNVLLSQLPKGAKVGTSSLRRMAQLQAVRPDLDIQPLRGNIDTRLRKLDQGDFDAIVLAAAGLHRMGWQSRITEYLSPGICIPAICQGILGIECRSDDKVLIEQLAQISHHETRVAADAERALLAGLDGGCQVPMAGYATVRDEGSIEMIAMVATPDGSKVLTSSQTGTDPVKVGAAAAAELLRMGAQDILAQVAQLEE